MKVAAHGRTVNGSWCQCHCAMEREMDCLCSSFWPAQIVRLRRNLRWVTEVFLWHIQRTAGTSEAADMDWLKSKLHRRPTLAEDQDSTYYKFESYIRTGRTEEALFLVDDLTEVALSSCFMPLAVLQIFDDNLEGITKVGLKTTTRSHSHICWMATTSNHPKFTFEWTVWRWRVELNTP